MWADAPALNVYDYLTDTSFLIIVIFTVLYAYKINGGNEGKDFITRYTCISLPITIKSTLLVIVLVVVALPLDYPELIEEEFGAALYEDVTLEEQITVLDQKLNKGAITQEEYGLARELIENPKAPNDNNINNADAYSDPTYNDDLYDDIYEDDFQSGPFMLLAMILAQLYVIWRYVTCFKLINKNQEAQA